MKQTLVILCAAAALALTATAVADDVILKDGRRFTGEILKESSDVVIIRTVGGHMEFRRSEVLQVVWKTEPKKIYRQRQGALDAKAVTGRLELARWCIAQGLDAEARHELETVLRLDPRNADAPALLAKIARATPETIALRVEVTLTDGSQVKGRLVNSVFSIDTPYGSLYIPTGIITSVVLGDDKTPDTIETTTFKAKGQMTEELFVVDSKLGRLSIARKDVREIALSQPSAAELAETAFNDTMRQYNFNGLDVILVVDATDGTGGVLLRLRQEAPKFCDAVRRFVPNAQFGLVAYRDEKAHDPAEFTWATQLTALAEKPDEFFKALGELRPKGGGDIPDAVFEGLSEAMTRGGWRPKSHHVVVLIGDAPPHLENQGLKKTLTLIGDWHKNAQGVVHAIDTTGYNRLMDEFRGIADAGGGKAVALADEKQIGREMLSLVLGADWRDRLMKTYDEIDAAAGPAKENPDAPPAP